MTTTPETLQERLYRLMADADQVAPNHTWPDGVLDDLIVGWVQGLQTAARNASRAQELEREIETLTKQLMQAREALDHERNNADVWRQEAERGTL